MELKLTGAVRKLAAEHELVVWSGGTPHTRKPIVTVGPNGDDPVTLEEFVAHARRMGAPAFYVQDDDGYVDFLVDGVPHRWSSSVRDADEDAAPRLTDRQRQLVERLVGQLVDNAAYRAAGSRKSRDGVARTSIDMLHEAELGSHEVLSRPLARLVMRDAHEQVEAEIREAYLSLRDDRDEFAGMVERLDQDAELTTTRNATARRKRLRELLTELHDGWPPPADLLNALLEHVHQPGRRRRRSS